MVGILLNFIWGRYTWYTELHSYAAVLLFLLILTFPHPMSFFPTCNLRLNWAVFPYEYRCSWIVCELSQGDSKLVTEGAEKTLKSFTDSFVFLGYFLCNVVLLGVVDQRIQEEVFRAEMERKLAHLLNEALVRGRIWRRASFAGSNVVQVWRAQSQRKK